MLQAIVTLGDSVLVQPPNALRTSIKPVDRPLLVPPNTLSTNPPAPPPPVVVVTTQPPPTVTLPPGVMPGTVLPTPPPVMVAPPVPLKLYERPAFWGIAGVLAGAILTAIVIR